MRVGVMDGDPILGIAPDGDCRQAVLHAGRVLESLGHHVEFSSPAALAGLFSPITDSISLVSAFARAAQVRWLQQVLGRGLTNDDLDAGLLAEASAGDAVTEADAQSAAERITATTNPILDWWNDFDLLITPTMRQPPWLLGQPSGPLQLAGDIYSPVQLHGSARAVGSPLSHGFRAAGRRPGHREPRPRSHAVARRPRVRVGRPLASTSTDSGNARMNGATGLARTTSNVGKEGTR
jgi:Asp-tRNA(Asn)/Glu-tRNA(Gln) amidotransferase A subunit family amidase